MKNLMLGLFLMFALPLSAYSDNSLSAHVVPGSGTDDAHIQAQVKAAQEQLARQGPGFGLVGKIERGHNTSFSVNGEDFIVSDKTQIVGDLKVGSTGEIIGKIVDGNKKIADTVTIAPQQVQSPIDSNPGLGHLR